MPLWPCANCHKELEKKDLKRCGQCQIVMYCSRECQKEAWNTGHKRTCQAHILNKNAMDGASFHHARREKSLSNWLNIWRGLFEEFTMRAFDLANHKGEERIKTHCYVMTIQETRSSDPSRAFQLLMSMVTPCSEVIESYSGIESLLEDPPEAREGIDRVKWVMILYDPRDEKSTCRVRVSGVSGLEYFYELDPKVSKEMADDAEAELKYLLENGEPEKVRRAYDCEFR